MNKQLYNITQALNASQSNNVSEALPLPPSTLSNM